MAGEYKANCSCKIHVAQCSLHKAAPELLKALKALLPKGWNDGTMDHMPGVKQAREAISKATGQP